MSMQNNRIRLLFIGDVVGRPGRRLLKRIVPHLREKLELDLVIANGENSAGGLGIIKKTAQELFECGIDVISGGNHMWDKREAQQLLQEDERILRPLNYPEEAGGYGYYSVKLRDGLSCLVVNLQGRVFMEPVVDNPFIKVDQFLKSRSDKMIIVDFHAEATAEKQALGFFLDGRVSAVLGTHTHVQTADYRILRKGTAYQTDVGMTGSLDSVIGMKIKPVLDKFITGINQRFEVARNGIFADVTYVEIDPDSGRSDKIECFKFKESDFFSEESL